MALVNERYETGKVCRLCMARYSLWYAHGYIVSTFPLSLDYGKVRKNLRNLISVDSWYFKATMLTIILYKVSKAVCNVTKQTKGLNFQVY